MNSRNQVITLGCRLNSYESQVIQDLAEKAKLENTVVINTCAVTAEAERQARQLIRKIHKENPTATIVVTGCSAQIKPQMYHEISGVTKVIGNEEKMHLKTYENLHNLDTVVVSDIMQINETASHLVSGFDGKARAFVQIQNGCDHRCTFCTIPYGRGNSRSVAIGEIVNQVKHLMSLGFEEIVFTGVDITAYGADLPGSPTLGEMCKRVLSLAPNLNRLRLSSLDPVEVDQAFWDLLSNEPRLMPHLHLSLQAGDNLILKRMKRRHLREDVIDFCQKAKKLRSDVIFGADLIAGFPTETDSMFANTLDIIDQCDLTYLHVFPYSSRDNTPAARMPQVEKAIIKKRAKQLREKGQEKLNAKFQAFQNKKVNVLVEEEQGDIIKGKTDHFMPITIKGNAPIASVVQANVIGMHTEYLEGVLI